MKADDIKHTLEYLDNHFRVTDAEVSKNVLKKLNCIKETSSQNGTYHSGMTIHEMMHGAANEVKAAIEKTLSHIEQFKSDSNLLFNESALDEIGEKCKNFYTGVYYFAFNQVEKETSPIGLPGVNEGITNPLALTLLTNEGLNMINSFIAEQKIKTKVKKDTADISIGKKSNKISMYLVIVTLIGILISLILGIYFR